MTAPTPDPVLEFIRRMWAIDHELQRVSKRMVSRIGLTAPQRLALRFIGRHAGLTLGNLAELLHLHAGTVTGIVRRLESLDLVIQTRSQEDSRRRHLTLTAQGQIVNRQRRGTVEAAVRRTVASVSAGDVAAASRVMDVLARNLAAE